MFKKKVQVVIFYIADGQEAEFLLLKMNERRKYYWQNVTGGVEGDENDEQAAIRECIEETALNKENIKSLVASNLEFTFTDQWQNKVIEKVFLLEIKKPWEVKLDPSEHCSFSWIKERDLTRESVHYKSNYLALMEIINK